MYSFVIYCYTPIQHLVLVVWKTIIIYPNVILFNVFLMSCYADMMAALKTGIAFIFIASIKVVYVCICILCIQLLSLNFFHWMDNSLTVNGIDMNMKIQMDKS